MDTDFRTEEDFHDEKSDPSNWVGCGGLNAGDPNSKTYIKGNMSVGEKSKNNVESKDDGECQPAT